MGWREYCGCFRSFKNDEKKDNEGNETYINLLLSLNGLKDTSEKSKKYVIVNE